MLARRSTLHPSISTDPIYYDGNQYFPRKACPSCKNCEFCHIKRKYFEGCSCGRYMTSNLGWLMLAWLALALCHFILYNYTDFTMFKSEMAKDIAVISPLIPLLIIHTYSFPTPATHKTCPRAE